MSTLTLFILFLARSSEAPADTAQPSLQETLTHPATLAIAGLAFLMLSALAIMAWIWLRHAKYDKVHMRIDL